MNAVEPLISTKLATAMDDLHDSIIRVRAERDQYRAALEDIVMGCKMMQHPAMNLTGSFARYVAEVRRVAEENLK